MSDRKIPPTNARLTKRALTFTFITAVTALGLGLSPARAEFITGPAGGGQSHENHQPGLGINYLIATSGAFPPRDSDDPLPDGSRFLGEITMFSDNFAPEGWAFTDGQLLPISSHTQLFSLLGTTYGGDGRTNFALPDLRGRSAMFFGDGPGLTSRQIGKRVGIDDVTLTQGQMPAHTHPMDPPFNETTSTGGDLAHTDMKPSLGINFYVPQTDTIDPLLGSVRMGAFHFTPYDTLPADGQLVGISANTELFSLLGTTFGGDGRSTFGLPDLRGRLVMHEGQGTGLTNRRLNDRVGVEQVTLIEDTMSVHNHPGPDAVDNAGGGQAHENMQPTNTLNYIIATEGIIPTLGSGTAYDPINSLEPFLGEIQLFAGNFAPQGFEFTDGQLLAVSSHTELFSLLGATYGGDGQTNFALPDLRGRVPVHDGEGSSGLRDWSLGEQDGQESIALSLNQLPSHTHNYIPEPSTFSLSVIAMIGLLAYGWRQRRRV